MVDTNAVDGGLMAILTESKVAENLKETILNVVGCANLEDFLGTVKEKGWEVGLQTVFLDKCTESTVKRNPLQLSRLRQAFRIGVAARQRSTAVASESGADIEKPLEATNSLELCKLRQQSYPHVSYDEYLTPAGNVMARVWRDFTGKATPSCP